MAGARRWSRRAPSTYQPACKPGSVGRRASPPRDGHSSGTLLARRLRQPTRTAKLRHKSRASPPTRRCPRRPYSVLLPVGFAVPLPLPEARCALTAPFHPCGSLAGVRGLFLCGTFPGLRRACARFGPAGRYPAPHVHGARTFLSGPPFGIGPKRPSGRLTRRDVRVFRSELNDVRATSLTDYAASPGSMDRRARPRVRAGSGAGMRSRPGASHRRRGAKPRGRSRT